MALDLEPPPIQEIFMRDGRMSAAWLRWLHRMREKVATAGAIAWTALDLTGSSLANLSTRLFTDLQFTGSNLTSIVTRSHSVLSDLSAADHVAGSIAFTATDKLLGRSTAGAGAGEEIALTAAARSVIDDATVGAMVDTLGGAASTGTGGLVRTASPTFTGTVTGPTFVSTAVVRLKGYTVATLPAGTQGDTAFVTDALGPAYLATVAGGGAVVTAVFYNGASWVCT